MNRLIGYTIGLALILLLLLRDPVKQFRRDYIMLRACHNRVMRIFRIPVFGRIVVLFWSLVGLLFSLCCLIAGPQFEIPHNVFATVLGFFGTIGSILLFIIVIYPKYWERFLEYNTPENNWYLKLLRFRPHLMRWVFIGFLVALLVWDLVDWLIMGNN